MFFFFRLSFSIFSSRRLMLVSMGLRNAAIFCRCSASSFFCSLRSAGLIDSMIGAGAFFSGFAMFFVSGRDALRASVLLSSLVLKSQSR